MFIKSVKTLCLFIVFIPHFLVAQANGFTVVLDPGHGGKDTGTQGSKRYKSIFEKDIVLSIALKVGEYLHQNEPDINVVYTRKTDVFVELFKRGAIANKANADLFISIHANWASPSAKGTETYVLGVHRNETNLAVAKLENDVILLEDSYEKHYSYNPKDPSSLIGLTLMQEDFLDQSIRMAKLVENKFSSVAGRHSKGVKQAGFVVLHQSSMPSVLIEVGFLSNHDEEDFLRTDEGQSKMAKSIFEAIKNYRNNIYHSNDGEQTIFVEPSENLPPDQDDNKISKNDEQVSVPTTKAIYKIQLAYGNQNLNTIPANFKGLKGVIKQKEGNMYRYFLGNTTDYDEIKKLLKTAQSKGYKDCFIVAFQNGKKVNVNDTLKSK